jgi:putative membrane protein
MKRTIAVVGAAAAALAISVGSAGARTDPSSHAGGLSGLDKQYLTTSIQGDLFEIRGGKLAERRSRNPYVLKLARTLITDHTKSLHQAAALARRLHVEVPSSPTDSQKWELAIVASLHNRRSFDRWYSSLEVGDHMQDISEASDEVSDGSNAEVRKDARDEIPVLREHLRLARQALAHR